MVDMTEIGIKIMNNLGALYKWQEDPFCSFS